LVLLRESKLQLESKDGVGVLQLAPFEILKV